MIKNHFSQTTVHDVASYILKVQGPMSPMKLQKLVYYTQAWSLVWDGCPLFADPIEAWIYGPVVASLYQLHKGTYHVERWPKGTAELTDSNERDTIDEVLSSYGHLSSFQLMALVHKEGLWCEARKNNTEISLEALQVFYSSQLRAALRGSTYV